MQLTISCPNCQWKPDTGKYWNCQSCGTEINMFADLARCVNCGFQHKKVSCVSYKGGCDKAFPFMDWYSGLDEGLQELNIFKTDDPDSE